MNKRVKIAILIALIGVISILALQVLWVSTSYKQEQKKLVQRVRPLIESTAHEIIQKNSTVWADSIRLYYGENLKPYIAGANYSTNSIIIEVLNPKTGLYNKIEKKCNNSSDLIKRESGMYILYHIHCCPEKFYHKVGCSTEPASGTLTGVVG